MGVVGKVLFGTVGLACLAGGYWVKRGAASPSELNAIAVSAGIPTSPSDFAPPHAKLDGENGASYYSEFRELCRAHDKGRESNWLKQARSPGFHSNPKLRSWLAETVGVRELALLISQKPSLFPKRDYSRPESIPLPELANWSTAAASFQLCALCDLEDHKPEDALNNLLASERIARLMDADPLGGVMITVASRIQTDNLTFLAAVLPGLPKTPTAMTSLRPMLEAAENDWRSKLKGRVFQIYRLCTGEFFEQNFPGIYYSSQENGRNLVALSATRGLWAKPLLQAAARLNASLKDVGDSYPKLDAALGRYRTDVAALGQPMIELWQVGESRDFSDTFRAVAKRQMLQVAAAHLIESKPLEVGKRRDPFSGEHLRLEGDAATWSVTNVPNASGVPGITLKFASGKLAFTELSEGG